MDVIEKLAKGIKTLTKEAATRNELLREQNRKLDKLVDLLVEAISPGPAPIEYAEPPGKEEAEKLAETDERTRQMIAEQKNESLETGTPPVKATFQ